MNVDEEMLGLIVTGVGVVVLERADARAASSFARNAGGEIAVSNSLHVFIGYAL